MLRSVLFHASLLVTGMFAAPLADIWDGKTNGLPSVELKIRQEESRIAGTIGFYFQTRGQDGKWQLGPKTVVPLLSPKLEGNVLTFETTHGKKHGSPELGPNNRYRVEFVGTNEARLHMYKGGAPPTGDGSGLKLTRRE